MATIDSLPVSIPGAAADLSTKQYLCGKMTSSGPNVCSVAGERVDFIIGNKPVATAAVDAYVERVMPAMAGGNIAKGDSVATLANGKLRTAIAGDFVVGLALEAGSDGQVIGILCTIAQPANTNYQAVAASGALNPSASHVELTIADTKAYTLAAGTVGHEIEIDVVAVSGTPLGTLTIADTFGTESLTHVFTAAGQGLRLRMLTTGWKVVSKRRMGARTVVVGTDVLTGYDMHARYNLSVTDTVTGAAAGGFNIPDGQVPGERIDVQVTVAGGSPDGEIDITALTLDGGAATKIDAIDGTSSHHAQFVWDGAAWQVVSITGLTLA
jgi:hypothetical protein